MTECKTMQEVRAIKEANAIKKQGWTLEQRMAHAEAVEKQLREEGFVFVSAKDEVLV